jgi:folate-binding Fe-S cluster repair protein YgfZ
VTNDVRSLEQPGAAPVYAALLSPKGKFLHDLILYQEQGLCLQFGDVSHLSGVSARSISRALQHLHRVCRQQG